ncbi:MAG: DEAD/DEAH box helicase, partial [Candidatus Xenobia bacterium]
MRHGIVHTLGWRELRPVQEAAINTVLEGCNAVILAPTAGGKTEAAALPVFDQVRQPGLAVLYLSPLRALLNNQEDRLHRLASLVGLRVFKWHGDVGAGEKRRFGRDPGEVLMVTPESLEGLLVAGNGPLFAGLRFCIIDEVHAFAGDDRGAHMMALIERLTQYASADFQRLGLSATVGHPETEL